MTIARRPRQATARRRLPSGTPQTYVGPDKATYAHVHAVDDKHAPKLATAYRKAAGLVVIDRAVLGRALASRNRQDLRHAVNAEPFLDAAGAGLSAHLLAAVVAAGQAARKVPIRRRKRASRTFAEPILALADMSFDASNPAAIAYAAANSGRRINDITAAMEQVINQAIERALALGFDADETADAIESVIGLNARQAQAYWNLYDSLTAAGVTPDSIADQVDAYAERAVASRAEAISRTEIMDAANAGQQLLWDDAVAQDLLNPAGLMREWIITPDDRLCPNCEEMVDEAALTTMTEPWDTPLGPVDWPPMHTYCRCTMGLVELT